MFKLEKVLFVLTVLTLSSSNFSLHASADHSHHKKKEQSGKRQELKDSDKKEIISILKTNEDLHASFFKYDATLIESNAKKIKSMFSKLTNKKIKSLLKFAGTKLDLMTSKNEKDENNKNYNIVSMALIHIVNTYNVGKEYNAYSCPMVKKKWIQNSKKQERVHNPYAANMKHCGGKDSNY